MKRHMYYKGNDGNMPCAYPSEAKQVCLSMQQVGEQLGRDVLTRRAMTILANAVKDGSYGAALEAVGRMAILAETMRYDEVSGAMDSERVYLRTLYQSTPRTDAPTRD